MSPPATTAWTLRARAYALPLLRPIVTSQVRAVVRHGWLLELRLPALGSRAAGSGRAPVGLGEVATWPGFGTDAVHLARCLDALPGEVHLAEALHADVQTAPLAVAAALTGAVARALGQALAGVDAPLAVLPPELQWGLELAALDLLGQLRGLPVARLLGEAPRAQVPVHALVADAASARALRGEGFAAFKAKVAHRDLADEGSHVAALRAAIGDAASLRLDANAGWSLPQARRALNLFAAQAPDWVEQPIAAGDVAGMAALVRQAAVPIAADEGAGSVADVAAHLNAGAADVVVLKPAFVGGAAATLAAAELVRARGARLCLTHAFESQVGCLGALHLAAALRLQQACGLLPGLREVSVVAALVPREGALHLGSAPGLGLETPP